MKAKLIFNLDKVEDTEKFRTACKSIQMQEALEKFSNLLYKYKKFGIPGHIKTPKELLDDISKDFDYYKKDIK